MSTFKKGNKVMLNPESTYHQKNPLPPSDFTEGKGYEVTYGGEADHFIRIVAEDGVERYYKAERFKTYTETMETKIKIGDKVTCVNPFRYGSEKTLGGLVKGETYTVKSVGDGSPNLVLAELPDIYPRTDRFVLAATPEPTPVRGRIYISGPMTGIPLDQHARIFGEAEKTLRAMGYDVVNPATMDAEQGHEGMTYHSYLQRDLVAILSQNLDVAFLPGWRNSRGATLEGYTAQQAGLNVSELIRAEAADVGDTTFEHYAATQPDGVLHTGFAKLVPVTQISAAYEAQGIVLGARRFTYGHPLDNFLKIAELWQATIGHKLAPGESIDIRDVAMLMMQVKIAREYNSPKGDNRVDIMGYGLAYDEALNELVARGGSLDAFLSDNVSLLRQNSALGADAVRHTDSTLSNGYQTGA